MKKPFKELELWRKILIILFWIFFWWLILPVKISENTPRYKRLKLQNKANKALIEINEREKERERWG